MHEPSEVFNQPAPLVGYNLLDGHAALRDALRFNDPGLDTTALHALGATLGSPQMQDHARLANRHRPVLHTHDRYGHRIDQVEFHPSYHVLLGAALRHGLHGTPWSRPSDAERPAC